MTRIDDFHITFNARHLNPKEVAESFIWSDSYEKLIQNNHSVILGARGCGKTTLMKMLTLPALHFWNNEKAKNIKDNINFYAIYISTDIYWDIKNHTYGEQLRKFEIFSEIISSFSVNSNVFLALCETFRNIIEFDLKDKNEDKEIELCKHLIKAWKFNSVIPKLEYIRDAINERIDQVNQLIQEAIFNYNTFDEIPKQDFFSLTFETSLEYIIPVFERIYSINNHKKWALCFDELEFAPQWLQKKLFISLRSKTQYLLYKLSASPILSKDLEDTLLTDYRPTSGNDLQIIKMWNSNDNDKFSEQIIASLLFKRTGSTDLNSFFGTNEIYDKSSDSYKKDSSFYIKTKSLIRKDNSFRTFLKSRGVDLNEPLPITKDQKDTIFRKIKPVVYYRDFYIEYVDLESNVRLRKRKTLDLISGIEVLKKISDGNPRWLIGIVNAILIRSLNRNVTKEIQYDEIMNVSQKFLNVIANIPIGISPKSLLEIIELIGEYFKSQVLGSQFNMDPKTTFLVDNNKNEVPDYLIDLLEKGISQGAFVLVDSEDEAFNFKIRGQKIKLSYLLAIRYGLPLRKYNHAKLSDCLRNSDGQISLFE